MGPIARWTIGKTNSDGYECLKMSIESFLRFYDAEVVICHNAPVESLPVDLRRFRLIDQSLHLDVGPQPKGVAWKLYPPRIDINCHEICIDNDIVFNTEIKEINKFFKLKCTLMLEDNSRTYGRFEKHVPPGFKINSGIYGMPPGFDLESFVRFYSGENWEKNAFYQHDKSETFDEQGIVALALLSHPDYLIIPNKTVANCEHVFTEAKGNHFIGLNRRNFHGPFRLYRSLSQKLQM
jgi:hypothetical protein